MSAEQGVMHGPLSESTTLHDMGPHVKEPGVGLNALLSFTSSYEHRPL